MLSLVCALNVPTAFAVDILTRKSDGVAYRGQVTKADVSSVTLKRTNGQEMIISVADIKSLQFEKEPADLGQARSNERSGAFDVALAKLQDVEKQASSLTKLGKENVAFLVARVKGKQALVDTAKADAAIAALEAFRANKTSFRYLEATLLQASLHAAKKETDKGKALLAEVEASAVAGYQLQAGVELGRLLLQSGDSAAALQSFDGVIQKCQGKPDATAAMYAGMLGKAMCMQNQNSIEEAIKTLDEVIAKAGESETGTLAEAWIRKGDCYRQQSETKSALMAYLHVDVLYSGEASQHAEALMRLSQLWGPSGHEDRAVEASARLAQKYPNSQWARGGGG